MADSEERKQPCGGKVRVTVTRKGSDADTPSESANQQALKIADSRCKAKQCGENKRCLYIEEDNSTEVSSETKKVKDPRTEREEEKEEFTVKVTTSGHCECRP